MNVFLVILYEDFKKLKRVFQKSSLPISVEVLPSLSISLQVINLPLNPKDLN